MSKPLYPSEINNPGIPSTQYPRKEAGISIRDHIAIQVLSSMMTSKMPSTDTEIMSYCSKAIDIADVMEGKLAINNNLYPKK